MDLFWPVLFLHVLGATIWTGGHLALSLVVLPRALRARDAQILKDFEAGYERIGMPALAVQIASGLWLALRMAPDWRGWFALGDPLNGAIALKLALLGATAALALNARFRVVPTLRAETLPLMAWHVRAVTALSVLFVAAGIFLRTGGF